MKKTNFNSDWIFYDYQTEVEKAVTLPHDATIGTDRDPNIRNGWLCGYFYGGKYRYTKKLFVPNQYADKTLYLEFEGVYRNSKVFVNDKLAHELVNGYIGFNLCLDEHLVYGEENEIRVEIDTPKTDHSRWYAGSGIYRDVSLYVSDKSAHIALNGVKVITVSYNPAKILVETKVVGSVSDNDVLLEIFDGNKTVAEAVGKSAEISIDNAKLWSDESPNLYTARVSIKGRDEQTVSFGVRKIEYGAAIGLLINGVETKLRGGCIHADNGILGCVTTDSTEERRVQNIKKAGFNAIRSAHHPASRALLDACDKYGLFVMDEAFDSWYRMKMVNDFSAAFYEEYKTVINAMTENCYNHPSVITYSIGNEIPETGSLKGKRFALDMVSQIKSYDKTRPVLICPSMRLAKDFIFDTPYAEVDEDEYLNSEERKKDDLAHYVKVWTRGLFNLLDVFEYTDERSKQDERVMNGLYEHLDMAGFNYYGEYYENLHKKHPDWVICGTETEGNKVKFHYDLMQQHKHVIGDFVWTLQDHLGEVNCVDMRYGDEKAGDKSYPWLINYAGILDIHGRPYFSLHKYRMIWGQEKGIYIAARVPTSKATPLFNNDRETDAIESWSFDGLEGEKTYIDIITDAVEAEVFINGKSIGRSKVENFTARFDAVYTPGKVMAVGYDEFGKEIYRNSLKTAGNETILTIKPDKTEVSSGEYCFIEIEVTDDYGTVKSYPEHDITVTVGGAGELAALGSANYINEQKFSGQTHKTYNGRLLAAIRGGDNAGDITITISADGIKSKEIKITCA